MGRVSLPSIEEPQNQARVFDHVIATIEVESEHLNAVDSRAQTLLEESANVLTKFWTSGN
jgi:hypothetical protein